MPDAFTSPLSPVQEQIWFLHQLAPDQCAYNLTFGVRLRGSLDVDALNAAMTALVRRHETLRSTIVDTAGDRPQQVVASPAPVVLPVEIVDTAHDAETTDDAETVAFALLRAQATLPFDPVQATFRPKLFRLSQRDHLLAMCLHHLVCDAGSYRVLMRDLGELYRAEVTGTDPDLPQLRLQYADYAIWQRENRASAGAAHALAYWRQRLRDAGDLDLRTDYPRPTVQSFRGQTLVRTLPAPLLPALDELSYQYRVTPFMILVTALLVVLARYTGQDDVVIGTVEAGRAMPEVASIVGPLVNSIVLRADLSGDPPFTDLLRQVRIMLLDAANHADMPFHRLVEADPRWRRPGRNPIFQVAINQLPAYPDWPTETGLAGHIMLIGSGGARFDLNLDVHRHHNGLHLYAEYCTDLFAAATIRRLLSRLDHVLAAVAAHPSQRLWQIPLLSQKERAAVLAAGQGERRPLLTAPVHQLVSQQARRTPDALAATGSDQMTYAELDRRSDALARYLRRRGVAHESIVAVAMDHCAEVLVAYLAVAKAGGAYLPLDPGQPAKWLDHVIDDAGAAHMLTRAADADRLPAWPDRDVVVIDDTWPQITAAANDELPELADEHSALYVLYNSDSTGDPKGLVVEHGALANYATWLAQQLPIRPGDVASQYFSLLCDVAHGGIFTNLITGATNALAPPQITLSPPAMAAFLRTHRCVHIAAPPAVLSMIDPVPYPDLRTVLAAGEPLHGSLVNQWNQPGRRFIRLHNPTRAAAGCTSYVCEHRHWRASPPIGRPIHNTRIYIVDRHGNPAPIGTPGELLIAGASPTRGHLRRPDLTVEESATDPLQPGQRAYRTGDLAKWRADGQVQLLGRIDAQVTPHDQRIDLEEIEAALITHPSVRDAAVALHGPPGSGHLRLVAYLVPGEGTDTAGEPATRISAQAVQAHLADHLPDHLVPTSYVVLGTLPLGPGGEVNRTALPEPTGPASGRPYLVPRTPHEQLVATTYGVVLGIGKVSADDDFFALGGTSLTLAAVLHHIKVRTGVVLAPRDLYAQPTVAAVAASLQAQTGSHQPAHRTAHRPAPVTARPPWRTGRTSQSSNEQR